MSCQLFDCRMHCTAKLAHTTSIVHMQGAAQLMFNALHLCCTTTFDRRCRRCCDRWDTGYVVVYMVVHCVMLWAIWRKHPFFVNNRHNIVTIDRICSFFALAQVWERRPHSLHTLIWRSPSKDASCCAVPSLRWPWRPAFAIR